MRIRFLYCTSVLLYSLLVSSTAQSQLQKIYLHPKTVAREKQSKFLDSIRFIPLEVKEGMQAGAYYNVEVTDKYLLLKDYQNKVIFLFLKDGRFVKNINYKQLGANFYPGYNQRTSQIVFFGNNKNYTLTPKDQVKIRLDWNNPRNRKYFKKYAIDLNDPLLTIKKEVPNEKDILQVDQYFDDYYMQGRIAPSTLYKDSLDYELKLYKGNKLVRSYFPYNRINEPRFLHTQENVSVSKGDMPSVFMVSRPYCDTIYQMIKDSLFPAYQLVLPLENSLPRSFYTKPFKNATERDNYRRNNGWMLHQIQGFYETPRFIFFSVRYFLNYDSYIYEKQTNTTYKTKNITADTSQYNLQLLPAFGLIRNARTFYRVQKAGDLITFFEKNKNTPVPKELQDFLNSKPAATTPVIVEFKFKN
jgi:hypothetical protein